MNLRVSEIKCLLCGHLAGYWVLGGGRRVPGVASQFSNGVSQHPTPNPRSRRCPRCQGPLFADASYERPRELGIDESQFLPEQDRPAALPGHESTRERRCVTCGASVQRAERCRRCYLRHRYATNPNVRAKQLAWQAAWRRRQAVEE